MRRFLVILASATILSVAAILFTSVSGWRAADDLGQFLAGVFFSESVNADLIRGKYSAPAPEEKTVKILIVPGHDNLTWGTQFRGMREAEINLAVSKELLGFLSKDKRVSAVLLRDSSGYNPDFSSYIVSNRNEISEYISSQRGIMKALLDKRYIEEPEGPYHNNARSDIAFRLYAANVWARSIAADLVIHVHFNDYPRRNQNAPGEYSGLAVYIPDRQYSNARASRELGEAIFSELSRYYPASDQPKESSGVVEDQTLIALGSNNTLDAAGVLVEYAYIYEPYLLKESVRAVHLKEMAFQTYRGVLKFLDSENWAAERKTFFLPHLFERSMVSGERDEDVVSLQAALLFDGSYPPEGFSIRDCPISGMFRECTTLAVKNFQKKYGIDQTGAVGPSTRKKLNSIYGAFE